MSHDLTLASKYDPADSIAVPDDGDDLDAVVVAVLFQTALNRTDLAKDGLLARVAWSGDLSVDAGGSNTSFAVNVGAIFQLVNASSSIVRVGSAAATTIGLSKTEGPLANLANSTWYYVYAFMSGGSVDYAISSTPPLASRRTKSGDSTRAYLGCFRTDSSGAPLPMFAVRGRNVYRRSAVTTTLEALRITSASAGPTDLTLAPGGSGTTLVPPHARIALLALQVGGSTGPNSLSVVTRGDTADNGLFVGSSDGQTMESQGELIADSNQAVSYTWSRGGSSGAGVVIVCGFLE